MDPGSRAHVQRYELMECVARGGMGEVFRAQAFGAHGFRKDVAIKRILPGLGHHPQFEQRFISEAKLAVTLTHANIDQVLDFGHDGEALFIAMEFVDGCDLDAVVVEHKLSGQPIPLGAIMHIAISACTALDFAHQRGVLHRDVSHSNVLLSRAGEVKLADFGLAKAEEGDLNLTGAKQILGKAPYMSPEQTRGEKLDARSDMFSVGIVVHELVTGKSLFGRSRPDKVLLAVNQGEIPVPSSLRPDLPAAFDAIILRALERDRDKRFESCAEMGQTLTEACYATGLVHTPRDVATLIADIAPPPAEAPKARTATTAAGPQLDPELDPRTTQTWVRKQTETDAGVTQWERTVESDGTPAKRKPIVAVIVITLAVLAGVGVAIMLYGRGEGCGSGGGGAAAGVVFDAATPEPEREPKREPEDVHIHDAVPAPAEVPPDAAPPAAIDAATRHPRTKNPGPRTATVAIYVDPWAHVYFRGKKLGTTPTKVRLPVGTQTLRLVNPDLGAARTVRVKVPSDKTYSFSL